MKSEKGQSLVEFALILPLLLLILFGIVDFGRAFHVYLTIDHAGREAARAASIGGDVNTVIQAAKDNGRDIDLQEGMIDVLPNDPTPNDVTIKITYPFTFITPVIEPVITWIKEKETIDITDITVMRME